MYFTGSGVPLDYSQALNWFLKSAKQGYAPAETNVGLALATGKGTSLDYVQAFVWLNLAAAQGDSGAVKALKNLRQIMTAAQAREGERRLKVSSLR
jgi:TPR repeat protein